MNYTFTDTDQIIEKTYKTSISTLFENKGETNVWFQSQSRLGLYDFQTNEKRVEFIFNELKKLT